VPAVQAPVTSRASFWLLAMPNVYIEALPKRCDGDPIDHYVVEDHADSTLKMDAPPRR
jgi:hypothetical protein